MKIPLHFVALACIASTVAIFPLGYRDSYNVAREIVPFQLSRDVSNLRTSENLNLVSSNWRINGSYLDLSASGVADLQNWAFLTVSDEVDFPPIAGEVFNFSGTFEALNLTSAAIRVILVVTHLPSVVTLYYTIGDSRIPLNNGSYRYYGISIPITGTTFSSSRNVSQDLSNQTTGVDLSWEIRSISLGFVTYPPNKTGVVPFQVSFSSTATFLSLSGTGSRATYLSDYNSWYYIFAGALLIASLVSVCEKALWRVVRLVIGKISPAIGEAA